MAKREVYQSSSIFVVSCRSNGFQYWQAVC